MSVFKLMRVAALLSVLFVVVVGTWQTERRMASWERPILVTVYPIVADDEAATARFVRKVAAADFDEVNAFINREARPYGFTVTPAFRFQVAAPGRLLPPDVPDRHDLFHVAWWSLKMRWWAWRRASGDGLVNGDIQMFVLYRSLKGNGEAGISVGMRKGRYGIVRAFASHGFQATNHVVFTHELLHVLGATDKYTLSTGEPNYPDGYAEPDRIPLFPQRYAEIMGGSVPLDYQSSAMPDSLGQCRIGRLTAIEIGFFDKLTPRR